MSDKVMTLHPEGKNGVNLDKTKYTIIRDTIIKHLKNGDYGFSELGILVKAELENNFEGSINWYFTTVKLDLEARGIIKRVNQSPQVLSLV